MPSHCTLCAEEPHQGQLIQHVKGLEGQASAQDDALHARRIICRMVADLVQPWKFRSAVQPAWIPDPAHLEGGRITFQGREEGVMTYPPQCDVGCCPVRAVSWGMVLSILPELAAPAIQARACRAVADGVRLHACLLPGDSLQLANLGPRLAKPTAVRDVEYVLSQDNKWVPHPGADRAPSSRIPCPNRIIDVSVLPSTPPPPKLLFRAPVLVATTLAHQDDNLAALRAHLSVGNLESRLQADTTGGMSFLKGTAHPSFPGSLPEAAAIHNQLWVRQAVVGFVHAALLQAPYRATLQRGLGTQGPVTWALLEGRAGIGQAQITEICRLLDGRRRGVDVPWWPAEPAGCEREQEGFIAFSPVGRLVFRRPTGQITDAGFVRALLRPQQAAMVLPGDVERIMGCVHATTSSCRCTSSFFTMCVGPRHNFTG